MIEVLAGLVFLVVIAGALAVLFKNEANLQEIKRRLEADRANQAEAQATQATRAETARRQVEERHRDEQAISDAKLDRGDRDHLDTDW